MRMPGRGDAPPAQPACVPQWQLPSNGMSLSRLPLFRIIQAYTPLPWQGAMRAWKAEPARQAGLENHMVSIRPAFDIDTFRT